jgi:hypothetical protein
VTPSRRVDDLHPHEHADEHERDVLEVVDGLVSERIVVRVRDVPRSDHEQPRREAHGRPEQDAQHRTQPGDPRERPEQRRRQQEEHQRSPQRDERERRRSVPDQHVLEHVAGEQVRIADRVERRDERQRPERDGEDEQDRTRPTRVIQPAAPAHADERLREQRDREPGADEDRRRRLPGRPGHWKISVVQSPPCNRTSCARAGPSGRSLKSTKKSRSTSIPPLGSQSTRSNHERSPG